MHNIDSSICPDVCCDDYFTLLTSEWCRGFKQSGERCPSTDDRECANAKACGKRSEWATFAVKMDLTFLIGQTYASKKLEQNALKMLGASLGRVVEIQIKS